MTLWPSLAATKSFTFEAGAFGSELPPIKCDGRSCFAAYDEGWPLTSPFVFAAPFVRPGAMTGCAIAGGKYQDV